MNAGQLNRKVTFLQYQESTDAVGGTEQTLVPAFTTWAMIEPARGREYYESQKLKDEDSYKITIRYRSNVTNSMRIQYQNTVYQIQSVTDPTTRHEFLELYCIVKHRGATT